VTAAGECGEPWSCSQAIAVVWNDCDRRVVCLALQIQCRINGRLVATCTEPNRVNPRWSHDINSILLPYQGGRLHVPAYQEVSTLPNILHIPTDPATILRLYTVSSRSQSNRVDSDRLNAAASRRFVCTVKETTGRSSSKLSSVIILYLKSPFDSVVLTLCWCRKLHYC